MSLVVLLLGAFIVLLLFVVFVTSLVLKIATLKNLWKNNWSLAIYQAARQQGKFLLMFANSTLVAIAVTAFKILTFTLAGCSQSTVKILGRPSSACCWLSW
ncbi:MAG: hypothetical protein V7K47_11340 [Nostoc sp.]